MAHHHADEQHSDHPVAAKQDARGFLEACAAGDALAWSTLLRTHAKLVYAVARAHGLEEDQCDDVAQTVFATLLRHAASIRDQEALPAWLAQTTRRLCWRIVQRQRRETAAQHAAHESLSNTPQDSPEAAAVLARFEDAHRVTLALDELGGRCRELLRAIFFESDKPDYDRIAERLSMPRGSIGPTRARCLGKLAELLDHGHDE